MSPPKRFKSSPRARLLSAIRFGAWGRGLTSGLEIATTPPRPTLNRQLTWRSPHYEVPRRSPATGDFVAPHGRADA